TAPSLYASLLFNYQAPPTTYTLSLHDALPISVRLDAGPGVPLADLRLGQCLLGRRLATLAQLPAPHLHQHPRPSRHCPNRRSARSEEHTSELQSRSDLVCRLLLEKKN